MDDGAILEDLRRRVAGSPFHAGFGVTVDGARAGEVRVSWNARPEHWNLQGLVHGGALATLVDIAARRPHRRRADTSTRDDRPERSLRPPRPTGWARSPRHRRPGGDSGGVR